VTIKPQDIDALIQLFEASDWDELSLKIDDLEIFLSTDPKARKPGAVPGPAPPTPQPAAAVPGQAAAATAAPAPIVPTSPVAPTNAPQPHWVKVTAPNLGTFYRAPKPGSPSFVEIGQAVDVDTEICLIEVMKLFTTLKSGVKGFVRQCCVQDAAMVEFGEVLFYIEPA
jgi:acetyl-CoA carboxylase biotin carboxyl carrier protein